LLRRGDVRTFGYLAARVAWCVWEGFKSDCWWSDQRGRERDVLDEVTKEAICATGHMVTCYQEYTPC
jgi:hypothetical protein